MADQDRITLRFLAAPGDATADGTSVQAGSVLEWIDKAGYACAVGWAAGPCVTAYVGNVNFTRAISPGELVELRARVIHTGRTSIHVSVTVASADARDPIYRLATNCILIFVAVDGEGRPAAVPSWTPRDIQDLELSAAAEGRVIARARIHDEMRAQVYTAAGTAPRITLRFLAAPSAVNFGGNAHGGTVLRWIDDAARTCAESWCGADAVAAYSGGIHFYRPIHIGDLVEVEARLIHTGKHSMHVAIHVRSGKPYEQALVPTTQCMSIMVSKDEQGKAREIVELAPQSDEDRALRDHAVRLVEMRSALAFLPVDFDE